MLFWPKGKTLRIRLCLSTVRETRSFRQSHGAGNRSGYNTPHFSLKTLDKFWSYTDCKKISRKLLQRGLRGSLTVMMKRRIEFRAYRDGGPNGHTRKIWKTIPRGRLDLQRRHISMFLAQIQCKPHEGKGESTW